MKVQVIPLKLDAIYTSTVQENVVIVLVGIKAHVSAIHLVDIAYALRVLITDYMSLVVMDKHLLTFGRRSRHG